MTDNIDELKTVKETIEGIYEVNKERYTKLMAGVPKEELDDFRRVLGGADILIDDEKATQVKVDEFKKANPEYDSEYE